jgi:hypothetical protein
MPIKALPENVALNIHHLLIQNHRDNLSDGEKLWYKKMFDTAIRHLEYFVEPLVSVNSQNIPDANGWGDLRLQRYRTPKAWPGGRELYWENATPVLDIRKSLMKLGANPNLEDILNIINQAEITWITRNEERLLPKTGRTDWREDYRRGGIVFVSEGMAK